MVSPIPRTPPHFSVNRVRIVDLPGLPIDEEVRGQRADDLLSNRAVTRYARGRAEALRLPAVYAQDTLETRLELPRFVDDCLSSTQGSVRAAARAIGRRLGRNLGHVLLALHRGDDVNRAARPDWTAQEWERWAQVKRVWLGGGLMSGKLGKLIVHHARAFLAEVGHEGRPQVALTAYPGALTLLGAGRYLPVTACNALCLDFGHTLVKRACLGFRDGTLTRLHRYESLMTHLDWLDTHRVPNPTTGRQVLDFVASAIARTLAACLADGLDPGPDLMLGVAAYVREGRLLGNGLYANLSTLSDDARPLLAQAVKARSGRVMQIHLIHDGTAACAVHAGEPGAAVIIVGTALGIGFPPADARGLRSIAPRLDIN